MCILWQGAFYSFELMAYHYEQHIFYLNVQLLWRKECLC